MGLDKHLEELGSISSQASKEYSMETVSNNTALYVERKIILKGFLS